MTIKFDLLENATDSIKQAIELLALPDEKSDARRLKQAILATAHGVELLLKERLRRVHPVLVWENVDRFPSLSARTVTVDIAMSRLINIGGLRDLAHDVDLIKSLRDTRNAIEHYVWSTTKEEADLIVGQALGFALHFSKSELNHDFFGYQARKDDIFSLLLEGNPDLSKAFNSRYEKGNKKFDDSLELCDYCHTLAVSSITGACHLCGHWNKEKEKQSSYSGNFDDFEDDIPF
ncbi:MAG: hypothetical protein CTY33_09530 [Methylotenera sp.]|nr:MAG: hypothetical protein CTY33_09530 [Methylotenera sp.]